MLGVFDSPTVVQIHSPFLFVSFRLWWLRFVSFFGFVRRTVPYCTKNRYSACRRTRRTWCASPLPRAWRRWRRRAGGSWRRPTPCAGLPRPPPLLLPPALPLARRRRRLLSRRRPPPRARAASRCAFAVLAVRGVGRGPFCPVSRC